MVQNKLPVNVVGCAIFREKRLSHESEMSVDRSEREDSSYFKTQIKEKFKINCATSVTNGSKIIQTLV
jgi:hypothetical protein